MEDVLKINKSNQVLQGLISASPKLKTEAEKEISLFLKTSENKIKKERSGIESPENAIGNTKSIELFQERGEYSTNELAGIYFQGTQYFDFKNVYFINNTGIANLIDLLKSLLKQGVVIKFVNVKENIKDKFKSMGLEFIFNCS